MTRQFSPGSGRLPLMGSALALVLAVGDVHALGLGGLRVQSALNQPFVGEIALLDVKPDELDGIKVQIASADEFSKAGSERYQYLSGLRFSPQISPRGETVIRVSSREPVREPYMDFLLEVIWAKGRLVKGYTVLLDPPVTAGRRTAQIQQPVAEPRGVGRRAVGDAGGPATAPAGPPGRAPTSAPPPLEPAPIPQGLAAAAGAFPKQIGPVPRGAGLWRLASRNVPAGATTAQTAMALYRNNQDAFIGGNINRLRVGKTLVIPSAAELFVLGPEAADREFAAALRGETVRRSPIAALTPSGSEGEPLLKIAGATTEGPTPEGPRAVAAVGPEGVEQELLLVREASESARQETAELRDRIRELEAQLGEIQRLLQLRNAELARIQGGPELAAATQVGPGEIGAEAPAAETPATEAAPSAIESGGQGPFGQASDTSPGEPAPAALGEAGEPAREGTATVPEATASLEPSAEAQPAAAPGPTETTAHPLPEAETPAPTPEAVATSEEAESSQGSPEVPGESTATVPEPSAPPREPSAATPTGFDLGLPPPWDELLLPVAGATGVTLLGLGALAFVRARRRRAAADADLSGLARPLPHGGAMLIPAKGAEATAEPSALGEPIAEVPSSVFSAVGAPHGDSDEADVLSEADIYIAYGRYREAEELLREEIQRTPGRIELKYKLAESYHGAKNYPALDRLMTQMQAAGEDRVDRERWQRLVDMAKAIEGLERAEAGVRPARDTPAIPDLVDRGGPFSGEAFSLDISDARGPLGVYGVPGGADGLLGSAADPSHRDVPVLRSSRPTPSARDDLDPLLLDLDVLPESLDLDVQPSPADLEAALEPAEGGSFGAVGDLELTIDDLRSASDVDLESFVDSTRTVSTLVDEPLSRPGASGDIHGQPPHLRAVTSGGDQYGDDQVLGGALYGLDEEGSSDLLSSQWQMDSGLWDETATKLDLARAYVEMGDQDSARGILEEVANEGNEAQRDEAAQMLRALG